MTTLHDIFKQFTVIKCHQSLLGKKELPQNMGLSVMVLRVSE